MQSGRQQDQPLQVVEFQKGLVQGLVNLHVLFLGTSQSFCEGKQQVRPGRVNRREPWTGRERQHSKKHVRRHFMDLGCVRRPGSC